MTTYITQVSATSNSSANTEDCFIEIKSAASTRDLIKRIRISCNTPNSDVDITARWIKVNTGTAGSPSVYTAVPTDVYGPAATATSNVKNGSTALALGTTITTYDQINFNGRAVYEWIPRGNEEFLNAGSAGIFELVIKVSSASVVLNASVTFEE